MKYKAYAKVNIFLKIVGIRGNYHEIKSRFMLVANLFDELSFVKKKTKEKFELHGDFGCELSKNTIYKAYIALCEAGFAKELDKLFDSYAVSVEKNIPSFAGLGGGSSDAAAFMHMIVDHTNLDLNDEELAKIGLKVGADVPFFIYNFKSANVSGIGEIVEKFEEVPLELEVFTPDIKCDTAEVYKTFRENCTIDLELSDKMFRTKSKVLLETYKDKELNDLLGPALQISKKLEDYRRKNWFFSGSGSSFFRLKETDKNG
ncbi:MAG: 4-(cytidine 5'-diphospho)-2-C-methyl-D-erythritol kinase [Sulfurospirillaceae bacterium]|nr:4-(cytidine 5'-diphospho)-2-C-methyl-D-erythritol kinase [Sulfurospirillaceae bacterium]